MTPRLASAVEASSLIKQAERAGGFGAVLQRGESNSGALLVVLLQRSEAWQVYERSLSPSGAYVWRAVFERQPDSTQVPQLIARRRQFDPDLWAIELDVPSAERFAAEMTAPN